MAVIMEALADGGVLVGIPRDLADKMAAYTMMVSHIIQWNLLKKTPLYKDTYCFPKSLLCNLTLYKRHLSIKDTLNSLIPMVSITEK